MNLPYNKRHYSIDSLTSIHNIFSLLLTHQKSVVGFHIFLTARWKLGHYLLWEHFCSRGLPL